ncbi:MAG: H(+)/Cl(-) exchange transporter ClcA [Phycisphaerales bacterium]
MDAVTAKKEWRGGAHLLGLVAVSLLAGGVVGLVAASFRLALEWAELRRVVVLEWARASPVGAVLVIAGCALAAALAAWLVQRFSPDSAGSGIPHVETVLQHDAPISTWRLVPVKFVGGLLAIGSGQALGREGPSVQMGATLAHEVGRWFGWTRMDCRSLLAAGAGAGLSTAFNAPIGGSVFVLEELVRRFDTRITIVTFGASSAAIGVTRLMLGSRAEFPLGEIIEPALAALPGFLLLGLLLGFAGVAYNRLIMGMLAMSDRAERIPRAARAAGVGAIVGVIGLLIPSAVGGGDLLTTGALHWDGTKAWWILAGLLLLRFVLGPLSYAAQTPGGLFAPLLAVGAQAGVLYGLGWNLLADAAWPRMHVEPPVMGVIAMVGLFAAVVRAPLTGIVLVAEMTVGTKLLLPMIGVCIGAMLVPTAMGNEPIYESLKLRAMRVSAKRG